MHFFAVVNELQAIITLWLGFVCLLSNKSFNYIKGL